MSMRAMCLAAAAVLAAASVFAAPAPPLAGVWNVAPSGRAGSSGEIIFRVTRADGSDPIDITVPVIMGAREETIARGIRNSLSSQLPPQNFDVQMGEGTNVLVSDARGQPNFSLELVDSDIEELRVAVQSVTPSAPPTVPEQTAPAVPAPAPASPAEPGQAAPDPGTQVPSQPATPPAGTTSPVPQPQPGADAPPANPMPVPPPANAPPASPGESPAGAGPSASIPPSG